MSDDLELLVPLHGKQEWEQVSVALPKADSILHGALSALSALSASPREAKMEVVG